MQVQHTSLAFGEAIDEGEGTRAEQGNSGFGKNIYEDEMKSCSPLNVVNVFTTCFVCVSLHVCAHLSISSY